MAAKRITVVGLAGEVREFRAEMGEFKSEMGEFKVETRAEFGNIREELRREIRGGDQETRAHMTVLVESLRDDFRIFMDAHLDLERRVRRLELGP